MGGIKKIAGSLVGLLIGLILLMLVLRLLRGVPVIGGIAADAQNLATSGTIAG
jgi:hypothetical protein